MRWRESLLLILAALVVLTGGVLGSLAANGSVTPLDLLAPIIFLIAVLALHVGLIVSGTRADPLLLPVVTVISGIGLVMIQRLVGPGIAIRQTAWLVVGVIVCALAIGLTRDLSALRRYKYSIATAGILLVALTFIFGRDLNNSGVRLWMGIGDYVFQPSELLKVLLVVFLAAYLDQYATVLAHGHYRLLGPIPLPPVPYLIPLVAMWGFAVLLLVVQRDLGAALLFFGIFVAMLYLASGRWIYLVVTIGAFSLAVYAAYYVVPIFQLRVDAWLDPWSRASESGYQVIQALIALAEGGVFGQGLGQGRPDFVPAIQTDFILVAIGEEIGLAGTVALMACYLVLVMRGFRVAAATPSSFGKLLAAGLTVTIAIQTFVIVAGVLRLMPLTGITLPYVSYGGSSIVVSYAILGLLLRIGSDAKV